MAAEVVVQLLHPAASGQRDGQNTMQKHTWEVAYSYERKRESGKKRLKYWETLQDLSQWSNFLSQDPTTERFYHLVAAL